MDTQTFYTTVSSISFTLLGLWWVVVQSREEWRERPARRRMAYAVSLHFLLPGVMSVLSLVAPDVGLLWRVSFSFAGALGVVGAILVLRTVREEYDAPAMARLIESVAIPVYGLVAIVALVPEAVNRLNIGLNPLQVESIILAIVIFGGVQLAWILMVEPVRDGASSTPTAGPSTAPKG
ncbi:MAG: hypothetical protein H0U58_06370 [Chloroflexi bacterium]|nr:hypothetical protein [Chloroflexota bacterium]